MQMMNNELERGISAPLKLSLKKPVDTSAILMANPFVTMDKKGWILESLPLRLWNRLLTSEKN